MNNNKNTYIIKRNNQSEINNNKNIKKIIKNRIHQIKKYINKS